MRNIINYIKKNRNIVLLIITFIFLTMLILNVTYAYFDLKTTIGESQSTMTIGGAEITANYSYSNNINITDALPGNDIIAYKDITLTYNNTSNDQYNVYLKTVIDYNTFTNEENGGILKYEIKNGNNTIQNQTTFPTIEYGKAVLKEIPIPSNSSGTITYRINFYFPETNTLQNPEEQLLLNATISLESDDSLEYHQSLLQRVYLTYKNSSNTNGLELDNTSDKNIRYVGTTPKNYISFNGETWRIIGAFNKITSIDSNGNKKIESLVKIIRNDSLGNYSWDSSESSINSGWGINEWSQADLMTELNIDYLDTSKTSGTTTWYNGSNNTKTATYDYSKNIKSTSIDKIANVRWNTNRATYGSSALNTYNQERSTTPINTPSDGITRNITWDGKVALMYPSDYGYASTDSSCRDNIGSYYSNYIGYCKNNNWLFNSPYYQWTLSPFSGSADRAFGFGSGGRVGSGVAYYGGAVSPALFLKSNVGITGGTGTETDPYTIETISNSETEFSKDSWETIANNVTNGFTLLYNVGDTKKVTIGGNEYTVRIANKSTPAECSTADFSQTACGFVIEFVDIVEKRQMNSTNTNAGGWRDSAMRTYLNGDFYNNLPTDLKSVITDTQVISGHGNRSTETNFATTDKIYLLSAHEVWTDGTSNKVSSYDTAYNNTRQLDYYQSKGVTTNSYSGAIKKYNGSSAYWWLRAANSYSANYFLYVYNDGYWGSISAYYSYGVSPAFRIG